MTMIGFNKFTVVNNIDVITLDDHSTNTILEFLFDTNMKSYLSCISTSKKMYEFDYIHRKRWMKLSITKYPNLCGIHRSNKFILERVKNKNYAKYLCHVNKLPFNDNDRFITLRKKLCQLEKIEVIGNIEINFDHYKYIHKLYVVKKPACLTWKQHCINITILKSEKCDKHEILARYIFAEFSKSKYSDMIRLYKEYINYLSYLNAGYGDLKRIHDMLDAIIYVFATNGYYNAIFDVIDSHYVIMAFKHIPLDMVLRYIDNMLDNNEMYAVDICEEIDDVIRQCSYNYDKYLRLPENFPDRFYVLANGLQPEYVFAIMKKFDRLNLEDMVMFINNDQYIVADLIMKHLKDTNSGELSNDISFNMITHYRSEINKIINYIISRDININWSLIFYQLDDEVDTEDEYDDTTIFAKILYTASLYNKLPTFDEWLIYMKDDNVPIHKKDISTTIMRNAGLIPYHGYV